MAKLVCKCGAWFDNGECPSCGKSQNPNKANREKSKREESLQILEDYRRTPGALEAKAFISSMFQDYAIPDGKTVFRNRQNGYARKIDDKYFIVLSWHTIDKFVEYPTFSWLWDSIAYSGLKAAWAICIHEFAHILQFEGGMVFRGKGGHHNDYWASKVQELQELYPFEWFLSKYN